jgi:hypothetical protein
VKQSSLATRRCDVPRPPSARRIDTRSNLRRAASAVHAGIWELSPWPASEAQEPPAAHPATAALGRPTSRDTHRAEQCPLRSLGVSQSLLLQGNDRPPRAAQPPPRTHCPPRRRLAPPSTHTSAPRQPYRRSASLSRRGGRLPSVATVVPRVTEDTCRRRCAPELTGAGIRMPATLNRPALLRTVRRATRIDVDVNRDPAISISRWLGRTALLTTRSVAVAPTYPAATSLSEPPPTDRRTLLCQPPPAGCFT